MQIFQPVKVENYQFMDSGLNQYEPLLVYTKDDEEDDKVYFVKNKFDDKLREWKEENLKIEGKNRIVANNNCGTISIDIYIKDLEDSIAKLTADVEELKYKLEKREKKSHIYNLMERIGEINGKEGLEINELKS